MNANFPLSISLLSLFTQGLQMPVLAQSSDWGYEDAPAPVRSTAAGASSKSNAAGGKASAPRSSQPKTQFSQQNQPKAESKPAPRPLSDKASWMEIFALAASSAEDDDRLAVRDLATLQDPLKENLQTFVNEKLESGAPSYTGIAPLWAEIRVKIQNNIDYKESYRLLFRALLRHWLLRTDRAASFDGHTAKALSIGEMPAAEKQAIKSSREEELFADLLGPARVAEAGPPPLTEDAIKAYSDMACFLYAKKHPDKSVDQDDNRQVFASVIRDKFVNAPTQKAQLAMSNFDLTWASFKCRYLDSTPAEKERMSISVSAPVKAEKSGTQANEDLTNKTIVALFQKGPWAENLKNVKTPVAKTNAASDRQ